MNQEHLVILDRVYQTVKVTSKGPRSQLKDVSTGQNGTI